MTHKKKLIEVALPLDDINEASAREKSIRHGHPSTLHLWWARRPLAAARAVIFAQMVDDPSEHPDQFPTPEAQAQERERLFDLIRKLVKWENTTNERLLAQAREEIRKSWRRTCAENRDHPRADELFDPEHLPAFHDPFAGGGALPLEAQRLGLEAYASDLNPVAVLINKAMIEIPPKFAGKAPVNPAARKDKSLFDREWKGAEGLAEDVRYYGEWMRDRAQERIGELYPSVQITEEMVGSRPDLKKYQGRELTVIAWLWARTVRSPNPAYADVHVPLVSNFMLSTKKGKEAYVEPVVEGNTYRFEVWKGKPKDVKAAKKGTKLSHGSFRCLLSDTPVPYAYIDDEANAGRMFARLMAIVLEGDRERVYMAPLTAHAAKASSAQPEWRPAIPSRGTWASNAQGRRYGFRTFGDYFTPRQLVALTAFSDLVQEAREQAREDAMAAGMGDDGQGLETGGTGARAYAEAVGVYLGMAVSRTADRGSTICSWDSSPKMEALRNTFGRQGIPMVWDFAEGNPFSASSGNWLNNIDWVSKATRSFSGNAPGRGEQLDATAIDAAQPRVVSTDPPYYDNIGYADLSDFFYVWLRKSLGASFPGIFSTLAVPKVEELVATPYRHGGKEAAEAFFIDGMTRAMAQLAREAHSAFPVTIYYAFKQSETRGDGGTSSTGWETFLEAVIAAGFGVSGTWPMRTELGNRMIGRDSNALASSVVLVCRRREATAPLATRREFLTALKAELPQAIANLQRGNVAPVDLAQAAIGPGMAVFTRFAHVKESDGTDMSVRTALQLINQVLDETLAQQEGDFDAETRWALAWFSEFGTEEGPYGRAETLCTAKNTSVSGMAEAGILTSGGGKVRLLPRTQLDPAWDPQKDKRLTVWETTQHLIRALEADGEEAAAALLGRLGAGIGETARELAYRLYSICERKKWAQEAIAQNSLVTAWPEISRLSREIRQPTAEQMDAF